MVKCKISSDWLCKTDSLGHRISTWAKKTSETDLFCVICLKTITCESKGFQAVSQHVSTKIHKENSLNKLSECQLRLARAANTTECDLPSSQTSSRETLISNQSSLIAYSTKDSTTKAEIIWTLKNVVSNMSAASCEGIADTFRAMFPESETKDFSLGRMKLAYLITDALGPHFRQLMIEEVQRTFYTIIYDETTNAEGKKELQVAIRFWSNSQEEISVRHLETFFLGYATGDILARHLEEALDNAELSKKRILMLSSDGPNVNKTVFRIMNNNIKDSRSKGLLQIGTCNIHTVHNAFLKGLEELGMDVSDLIINIYYFFKGWPTRWADFSTIQKRQCLPTHRIIKHVSSRWLTMFPAASRLLEQWMALFEYFIKFIPKEKNELMKSAKYLKIKNSIQKPLMKAEVQFIIDSADIFQTFTGLFQRQEPLIHVLYDELLQLLLTLLGRACKPDVQKRFEEMTEDNIFSEENLLPAKEVVIGREASQTIAHLGDREKLTFKLRAQKHYMAAVKHLLKKTSLQSNLVSKLKHFRFLQPQEMSKERSARSLLKVADMFPEQVTASKLLDEWKLLQLENLKSEKNERIDHYWRQVFQKTNSFGELKYPNITQVVKCSLTLSHGSADIERGFSISGRVLTDDKTAMSLRTLNARLHIRDGMIQYKNRPEFVPITKKLLISAQNAHKKYQQYLKDEKQKKEEQNRKETEKAEIERNIIEAEKEFEKSTDNIKSLESELKKAKNLEKDKKKSAENILREANERLKRALQNRNMDEAMLAQGILEGAQVLSREVRETESVTSILQQKIDKRKSCLITKFFKKPRKE